MGHEVRKLGLLPLQERHALFGVVRGSWNEQVYGAMIDGYISGGMLEMATALYSEASTSIPVNRMGVLRNIHMKVLLSSGRQEEVRGAARSTADLLDFIEGGAGLGGTVGRWRQVRLGHRRCRVRRVGRFLLGWR